MRVRAVGYAEPMPPIVRPPQPPPHAALAVKRAMDLLVADLGQPPSMPELAEEVGYSVAHFSRMFTAVMGVPPNAWLATQRFKVAKEHLFHGTASVTDICMGLGFTSLTTFSRRFAAEVGIAPTHFRSVGDMLADHPARHLHLCGNTPGGATVVGQICLPEGAPAGLDIYVGLFKRRAAIGIPETGTLLPHGVTEVVFEHVSPGAYWVLCSALSVADMRDQILVDRPLQGGMPIVVTQDRTIPPRFLVQLDHPHDLSAHIVVTLPLLTSAVFADRLRVRQPRFIDGRRIG